MSMENSNDTSGNRTRDLRACSAVPQPTAPPRVPSYSSTNRNLVGTLRFMSKKTAMLLCKIWGFSHRVKPWRLVDKYRHLWETSCLLVCRKEGSSTRQHGVKFHNTVTVLGRISNRQHGCTTPFSRRAHKTAKVTISFVMSVRPSIRTEKLGFHWRDFHKIWHLIILNTKKGRRIAKSDC